MRWVISGVLVSLGLVLILYGYSGEPALLALGMDIPLLAGVATRLLILSRLIFFATKKPFDIKIFYLAFFAASFYYFDSGDIVNAVVPEARLVGLLVTYLCMGIILLRFDLSRAEIKLPNPDTDSSA